MDSASPRSKTQSDQLPQTRSEWVISIREKLNEAQQYAAAERLRKGCCIYRVPRRLKDVQNDRKALVPQTVSLGPHHRGSEQVQDMDLRKRIVLDHILKRTGQDLNLYLYSIEQVEEQARACYQQEVGLSSYEFVEMMVLDGCFILELLRCYPAVLYGGEMSSPIFAKQRMVNDILLDMVMLENQIPLFIIDKLHELICTGDDARGLQRPKASALILNLFNPEWLTAKPISPEELKSLQREECLHVLDVFRKSLHAKPQQATKYRHWLFPANSDQQGTKRSQLIHSVTLLRVGGVKFKKRDTNYFWDIRFENGILEIPTIFIRDGTMSILLNVAIYEQCHLKITDALIASYVIFMECLVKSPEDVACLHRLGIIQHFLGRDAEVVDMFKSVSREILVEPHKGFYANLSNQVNAYCNDRCHGWRAILLNEYISNPWAIVSLVAATILLLLTAIQSFYAVYSYHNPNS